MTKTLNTLIYYVLLTPTIFFDHSHFHLYFGIVFVIIQFITIASAYFITNRIVPSEFYLVKKGAPDTLKDLFLVILFIIIWLAGLNLIFKIFLLQQLVVFICIAVISVIIQFLITRNKNTPTLLIQGSKLLVNDIILKTYNLEALQSITFDGFNEVYLANFRDSRRLSINLKDFRQEELNTFLGLMKSKSIGNVLVSANIESDLSVACP